MDQPVFVMHLANSTNRSWETSGFREELPETLTDVESKASKISEEGIMILRFIDTSPVDNKQSIKIPMIS